MKLENKAKTGLRRKFFRSLFTGVLVASLAAFAVTQIKQHRDDDEMPHALRQVLEWNGSLWQKWGGAQNSVDKKRFSPKHKPRVNGNLGLESQIDLAHYQVNVESGDQKIALPLSAFQALPKTGYTTDFRCIEGWSEVTQYAGARFSDFLAAYHLGKKPDGYYYRYVGLETPDGEYFVSIDMDSMLHPQTVLAYEMNENALSADNGAPLRLIIPIKYGIKSLKRIGRIFFSDTRPPDYWAEEGYDWFSGL